MLVFAYIVSPAKGKADVSVTTINVGSVPIYSTKNVQLSAIPKLLVCIASEENTGFKWIFAMKGTTLLEKGHVGNVGDDIVKSISINSNKVLSFYNSLGAPNTCTIYCIY